MKTSHAGVDWVDFKRDSATGIESVHAQFHGHAYDPHDHDELLIGVTLQGVQQFTCSRKTYQSVPGRVILIEPGQVHDGLAPDSHGFTYAMLYLPIRWLHSRGNALADKPSCGSSFEFNQVVAEDEVLAQSIWQAFSAHHLGDAQIVCDHFFDELPARLEPHRMAMAPRTVGQCSITSRAREFLHANLATDIGLDAVAAACGIDRFRLSRQFTDSFGLPPHAYLVRLRLKAARALLAAGGAPAEVASEVGFADQSHMGRWFRRAYRMSPAAYRQAAQVF